MSVPDLCRKNCISDATFDKVANEIRRTGSPRREETPPAGRRKPAVKADGGGALEIQALKALNAKKLVKPQAKRTAARLLVARFGLSQRRGCRLVALDRITLRYQSRRSDDQGRLARMRAIADTKRRYGCPRIYVRLSAIVRARSARSAVSR